MKTDGTDPTKRHQTPRHSDEQPSLKVNEAPILDGLRADIMNFDESAARDSGHDIRGIVGTALRFFPEVRRDMMPADSGAATPKEVSNALSEIGRAVFIPRDEVLDVRLLGERFGVISGKIDPSSYKSIPYLGRQIETAEVRFSHGIENSMGLNLGNLAMTDPHLIRVDCDNFLAQLEFLTPINPFGSVLMRIVEAREISNEECCQVAGLNRLLKEEIQHAKDAVFISIMTEKEGAALHERRQDVLLRPNSPLRQVLCLDTAESVVGSAAVSEYSSSLGGLIMELDQYLKTEHYDSAKLAVVDFLTQQSLRSVPALQGSMSLMYHIAALAFFDRLHEVMPTVETVPDMLTALFPGVTPREQVEGCRRILSEMYSKDLVPDSERVTLIGS